MGGAEKREGSQDGLSETGRRERRIDTARGIRGGRPEHPVFTQRVSHARSCRLPSSSKKTKKNTQPRLPSPRLRPPPSSAEALATLTGELKTLSRVNGERPDTISEQPEPRSNKVNAHGRKHEKEKGEERLTGL